MKKNAKLPSLWAVAFYVALIYGMSFWAGYSLLETRIHLANVITGVLLAFMTHWGDRFFGSRIKKNAGKAAQKWVERKESD